MFEHGAGVGGSKVAWLGAEIEEDRVRLPMSQGTDGSLVNARDEEGGGTPGAEAVGFDAIRRDVSDVVDGGGGTAEFGSDVPGSNIVGPAGGVKVAIQGRVGGGVEGTQVFNSLAEGADRTKVDVTGHAVSKSFTAGAVLLISVGKGCVGPLLQVMQVAVTGGEALDKGTAEGCVGKPEKLAVAMIGGGGEGVFARGRGRIHPGGKGRRKQR